MSFLSPLYPFNEKRGYVTPPTPTGPTTPTPSGPTHELQKRNNSAPRGTDHDPYMPSDPPTAQLILREHADEVNRNILNARNDRIAQAFHEAYELLAPRFSYTTRPESAVPWEDVPANNKSLMRSVVSKLLEDGAIRE